ncbi:nuclear pore complex protein NUP1 [Helianthus annuus]|uniref:Uncharacterized protein n=1 Tax=Helianthus annuus TaxID=4232 RepID=A0A251VGI7_HELAN|nr:nuclear pore complex protein NUP1 [Helianthus annuus]
MATPGDVTAPYQTTGAGGKLRKKPTRRSIPYDRPLTALKNSNSSLLKKLVDPASRLVYDGARRLFEVFRKHLPPLSLQRPLGINEEPHNTPKDERRSDSLANTAAATGISELEQMLQEETFSRSEIQRLTSLLHSRTTESPSDSLEKAARGNFHAAISTPIVASKVIKEISSPAELTKSYMGSRSKLIQRTPITPAAQKAANSLRDLENGFMTPRSRGRSAMYTMARTPYTRSPIFSQKGIRSDYVHDAASTSSRLGHEGKMALKRNSSVLDDVIGSGGPLRRIRQKANVSSQRDKKELGCTVFQQDGSSQNLVLYKETEPKVSGYASVPAKSTQTANKILQHLEKPSPKEKNKTEAIVSRKFPVPTSMLTLVSDESTGSLKGKAPVGFTDLPSKVQEEPPRKKRATDYTFKIDDDIHDNGHVSFSLVKNNKPESSIADIIKTPSPPEVSETHTLVENNNNLILPEIAKVTQHAEVIHSSVLPQSTLQTGNIAPEKDSSSLSFVKTAENVTPAPFSASEPSELELMSSSDQKTNYSTSVNGNGNHQKSTGGSFLFGTATENLSAPFPAPASTSAAISTATTASTAVFTAATTTAANFSTSVPPTVFSFGSTYSTALTTSTAETANTTTTTTTTSPFSAITTTTTGSSLFGFSSPAATITTTASQPSGSFLNITNGSQTNTLASSSGTLFGSSPSFDIGSLGPTSETKSGHSASGPTTNIFGSTWQQPQNSSTLSSVFAFGASPTPTPTPSFATGGATSSSFAGLPVFGAVATSPNNNNDDQMSMEDSMAEDSMQTQSPVSPFGQASVGATPAPTQTLTPTVVPFQFGGQSNQATAPQNSFQSSSFNGGVGSFSLGSGGEKSNRRIVRVMKSKNRKK